MKPEEQLQIAIVQYLRAQYPRVFFHHSPNGEIRPSKINKTGKRYSPAGTRLKQMGTQAGFPDLFIAQTKWVGKDICYGALLLELKAPDGKLSDNQKNCMAKLIEAGYKCEVVYSLDEAIKIIDSYLR